MAGIVIILVMVLLGEVLAMIFCAFSLSWRHFRFQGDWGQVYCPTPRPKKWDKWTCPQFKLL